MQSKNNVRKQERRMTEQLVFREISILESEIALLALTPRTLPVEVYVDSLLVFLCDGLWL
jgi:hypothetical protein